MGRPGIEPSREPPAPRERWAAPGTGAWYDEERWGGSRHRERDPRLVTSLLARHGSFETLGRPARILDAPCGTGRLRTTLEAFGTSVGVDASPEMLARVRGGAPLACADVAHLPFADGTFDAVVCCRLLHHLRTRAELEPVLAELVRVSRGLVLGSFWDTRSLAALRARLALARRPRGRVAHPKERMAAALEAAGASPVGWLHAARFLSRQTWFVARKRDARP